MGNHTSDGWKLDGVMQPMRHAIGVRVDDDGVNDGKELKASTSSNTSSKFEPTTLHNHDTAHVSRDPFNVT